MERVMKDSEIEWIGLIPEDWKMIKYKYLGALQSGYPFDSARFNSFKGFPLIRIRDITSGEINTFYDGDFPEEYIVKSGDLLIGMDGDFNVREWSNKDALLNQRCCRVIPYEKVLKRFIMYYVQRPLKYINDLTYSTTVKHLSNEKINEIYVCVPEVEEQEKIVKFLDEKVEEIDKIINATKESIDVYKKYEQAVITEVITQGLDKSVVIIDTDNIHIPKIPAHWQMKKMKYIFEIKKDIAGKEGYDILSITQKGIKIKDISKNEGQLAQNYSNYQLVDIGDFAMNHMDLLTGWVDISKYAGVTSPDYRVFRFIDATGYDADYYLYLMQMCYMNRIFYGLGQGVSNLGRWRLQADKFLNFTIPEPPLKEQQEIAKYLSARCTEIDALIAKKEAFVSEMEAYKKSLIYEYVTGKKEVL